MIAIARVSSYGSCWADNPLSRIEVLDHGSLDKRRAARLKLGVEHSLSFDLNQSARPTDIERVATRTHASRLVRLPLWHS
jgi:hypothetical protein